MSWAYSFLRSPGWAPLKDSFCVLQRTPDWPPDYTAHFAWRQKQLLRLRDEPKLLIGAKEFYKNNPIEFINHWCDTWDPRNASMDGKSVRMPFILFKRQIEFIEFVLACLRDEEAGLIEKSRDMGATWLCVALSVWLWLFHPGSAIGWGSATQPKVDNIGDLSSIFEKIRRLIMGLPSLFLPVGFSRRDHLMFMRCINPENGASIIGEIGDNIGRGGRTTVYFKDESAHYMHPEVIEASLSDTTRIPIDISSVNGPGNVFHIKRETGIEYVPGVKLEKGRTRVFVMDWREHPEKTQAWYDERRTDYERRGLLHILAQEIDRSYVAALEGVIIADVWVKAAIDAHLKLNFDDGHDIDKTIAGLAGNQQKRSMEDGPWVAALDVADSGGDTNAIAKRKGVVLRNVKEWGERDTGLTARRAVSECEGLGQIELQYDSIGVGAGVKAETNRLNDEKIMPKGIHLVPWNAGATVLRPNDRVNPDDKDSPKNKDFYVNLKAQGWWELRNRFFRTYQAVVQGIKHDPDDLISLDSRMPLLRKIEKELCQATSSRNSRMKLLVDKSPEGTRSPNCADAIVMCYWPIPKPVGQILGLGPKVYQDGERVN